MDAKTAKLLIDFFSWSCGLSAMFLPFYWYLKGASVLRQIVLLIAIFFASAIVANFVAEKYGLPFVVESLQPSFLEYFKYYLMNFGGLYIASLFVYFVLKKFEKNPRP